MISIRCKVCKKKFQVLPHRQETAKTCSNKCRHKWRSISYTGSNHPDWQPWPREKVCKYCGKKFQQRGTEAISEFRKRKFCSMECAKYGQNRLCGKRHQLWNKNSRRNNRRGKHGSWARAVISRDKATCQKCAAKNIQLHAHHILPFKSHPKNRWDLSNGLTLCYQCHRIEHNCTKRK